MKLGRCPGCGHSFVLVNVYRCGCGGEHGRILYGRCVSPITESVLRPHECGSRLRPVGRSMMLGG